MNEVVLNEQNQLAQQVIDEIVSIQKGLKELKARDEELKSKLTQIMGDNMIKDIDNEYFKITYFPENESPRLDSKKLKEEHEGVYLECLKKSTVKAFVKITLK